MRWVRAAVGNALVIAVVATFVAMGVVATYLVLAEPAQATATESDVVTFIKSAGGGNIKG